MGLPIWKTKATVFIYSNHLNVVPFKLPDGLIKTCLLLGTCDANDAVNITIVQSDEQKLKTLSSFHPQFTYPIFGDDEQIFGYKGLIIRLRFAAHDLRPHLHISYDEKFKPVGDTAASDLLKILKPWVSEGQFD